MSVWPQEINGILYYIDNYNNVYKTEDIIANKIVFQELPSLNLIKKKKLSSILKETFIFYQKEFDIGVNLFMKLFDMQNIVYL